MPPKTPRQYVQPATGPHYFTPEGLEWYNTNPYGGVLRLHTHVPYYLPPEVVQNLSYVVSEQAMSPPVLARGVPLGVWYVTERPPEWPDVEVPRTDYEWLESMNSEESSEQNADKEGKDNTSDQK